MTNKLQYYSRNHPKLGENVLVQFHENKDSFFDGILLQYNYKAFMTHEDATRKKKIKNWNKIITLNKLMVACVEKVDENKCIVQLSIAFFDEDEKEQNQLMNPFTENKKLENFIKSLCTINNYEYADVWIQFVHPLDIIRYQHNEEENDDEEKSLWSYFCYIIDDLEMKLNLPNNKLLEKIKKLYNEKYNNEYKIKSRIGIFSVEGITNMKEVLQNILSQFKFNYTLKYDKSPYYILETNSSDSTQQDHNNFISKLKLEKSLIID